jgi:hypothetical protein
MRIVAQIAPKPGPGLSENPFARKFSERESIGQCERAAHRRPPARRRAVTKPDAKGLAAPGGESPCRSADAGLFQQRHADKLSGSVAFPGRSQSISFPLRRLARRNPACRVDAG